MGLTTTTGRPSQAGAGQAVPRAAQRDGLLGQEWQNLLAQMPPDLRQYMLRMTGCLGNTYVPPLDESAPEDEMYGQ